VMAVDFADIAEVLQSMELMKSWQDSKENESKICRFFAIYNKRKKRKEAYTCNKTSDHRKPRDQDCIAALDQAVDPTLFINLPPSR